MDLLGRLKEVYANIDGKNFTVFDYMAVCGSPFEAVMYSKLFWPKFVEVKGMLFLESTVEDNEDKKSILEQLKSNSGDKKKTEQEFNLIEIPSSFFSAKMGDTNDDEDEYLSKILVQAWSAKLKLDFPDREYQVDYLSCEKTGGEHGITFCRV